MKFKSIIRNIFQPIAHRTRSKVLKQKQKLEHHNWVSATKTHNYMLKDGICDWLKLYGKNERINYKRKVKNYENTFTNFLMDKGLEFEKEVIKYLKSNFKCIKVADFYTLADAKKTLKFMKQGVPIIYSAPIYNEGNKTYGIIDLLVRSDYINKIFHYNILSPIEEKRQAPLFDKKYHYRVIDIKYSTLNLASDGIHLLNSGRNPAYKSQLYIYNRAISQLQQYDPGCAYIMGRRWKYNSRGKKYFGDNCNDKLGVVNFNGYDSEYVTKTSEAISWYRDVMKNGINWTLYPPSNKHLYPNMSVDSNNFNEMKNKVANNIGEITMLWNCGVKNREQAMKHGVNNWKDIRCNSNVLGFKNDNKNGKIVDKMISINRDLQVDILPNRLYNQDKYWMREQKYEMFVDFETFNDICMNMTIPKQKKFSMIYMIGIGIKDTYNNWFYKSFIADKPTKNEELKIIKQFIDYYNELNQPNVYYWCAEKNFWNSSTKSHNIDVHINWKDMCKIFKDEQIIIKNCFGFGLKEITKNMKEFGMIDTELESECTNGMVAMMKAWKCYSLKNPSSSPIMKDIEKYNEFDCKAMFDILTFLRRRYR